MSLDQKNLREGHSSVPFTPFLLYGQGQTLETPGTKLTVWTSQIPYKNPHYGQIDNLVDKQEPLFQNTQRQCNGSYKWNLAQGSPTLHISVLAQPEPLADRILSEAASLTRSSVL